MSAIREKYANWSLLDFLQFILIKHRIRLAKKAEKKHILFWHVTKPNVFQRFKELNYRIYAQGGEHGYTWIFW